MNEEVAARLVRLTREFYQSFADEFAGSRPRPQPGVKRVLADVRRGAAVLDLGCGHGQVAAELRRLGHVGRYVGIDSQSRLLELARAISLPQAEYRIAELTAPGWAGGLTGAFDHVLLFALLHHIPGVALRRRLLGEARRLLSPGGRMSLSVWNVFESRRLMGRRVPWSEAGLSEREVDPGDLLLDWRRGGRGLRYVHGFTRGELADLADGCGLRVEEAFLSDGASRAMATYQTWSSPAAPSLRLDSASAAAVE